MTLDGLTSSYHSTMGYHFMTIGPLITLLELDACLTGLGGRWCTFVYHLPIVEGYMSCSIVHLEMVNILLSVRLFQAQLAGKKV